MSQERIERWLKRAGKWAAITVPAILVLYVLSAGPMLRLAAFDHLPQPMNLWVFSIYSPLLAETNTRILIWPAIEVESPTPLFGKYMRFWMRFARPTGETPSPLNFELRKQELR